MRPTQRMKQVYDMAAKKQQIVDHLIAPVYEYIHREVTQELQEIRVKQFHLTGTSQFLFRNVFYGTDLCQKPVPLHQHLYQEMVMWDKKQSEVKAEKATVSAYIASVLSLSANPKDWVTIITDYFKEPLEKYLKEHNITSNSPEIATPQMVEAFNALQKLPLEYLKTRFVYNFMQRY